MGVISNATTLLKCEMRKIPKLVAMKTIPRYLVCESWERDNEPHLGGPSPLIFANPYSPDLRIVLPSKSQFVLSKFGPFET